MRAARYGRRSAMKPSLPSSRRHPPNAPLTEAEQRERAAYIERNLWLALVGLLLFFLALWGA